MRIGFRRLEQRPQSLKHFSSLQPLPIHGWGSAQHDLVHLPLLILHGIQTPTRLRRVALAQSFRKKHAEGARIQLHAHVIAGQTGEKGSKAAEYKQAVHLQKQIRRGFYSLVFTNPHISSNSGVAHPSRIRGIARLCNPLWSRNCKKNSKSSKVIPRVSL